MTTTSAQSMTIPRVGKYFYSKIFSQWFSLNSSLCRLSPRPVRTSHVPGLPPPHLFLEVRPQHQPRGPGAPLRPRQDPHRSTRWDKQQPPTLFLLYTDHHDNIGNLFDNPRLLHHQQGNSVVKIIALCQVLLSQTQQSGLANDRWVSGSQATLCIKPLR